MDIRIPPSNNIISNIFCLSNIFSEINEFGFSINK